MLSAGKVSSFSAFLLSSYQRYEAQFDSF